MSAGARWIVALVALAVAAGCGGDGPAADKQAGKHLEPFELMLDYFPNADHAGIYAAEAGGHFSAAGLELAIRQPPDPAAPLTSLISLPEAKIERAEDLAGKRVGTAGIDYQSAYLDTILAKAGVPRSRVRERNVGFSLSPALLTGRVDAVLGAFWNYEGTELRLKGRDPRILRMEQVGVPTYDELVLVASERALRERGRQIRSFLAALARGAADLERDPGRAIEGLLEANRDLDPKLQREVVKVTLPLFAAPPGKPYGYQDPAEWRAFGDWMHANRLLKRAGADGAFTNEYLPPAEG